MTITLAVCFYRDIEILLRTLDSIASQSRRPDEVVIADDGSDETLGAPIAEWSNQAQVPIIHAWHPKTGFRQSEMRNKAAYLATSKFVSYIDHDCLLPRGFVHGHLQFASSERVHLGPRINVMPPATATFRPAFVPILRALAGGRLYEWKSAIHGSSVHRKPPKVIAGCNMVAPKSVITALNGFDETYKSWGFEDADFVVRAWQAGYQMGLSGFRTTVFHLHHPSRANNANQPLFETTVAERRVWCENGISKHDTARLTRSSQGCYTRVEFDH